MWQPDFNGLWRATTPKDKVGAATYLGPIISVAKGKATSLLHRLLVTLLTKVGVSASARCPMVLHNGKTSSSHTHFHAAVWRHLF